MGLNPFGKLMDQAKIFQGSLASIKVTGTSGAGMVKVEMDGHYHVLQLTVEDELYQEEKAVVLDLIKAAINDASGKVGQAIKDKMTEIASQFGLPANFKFPF